MKSHSEEVSKSEPSTLRGFGFLFDIANATIRSWYIDKDGVKRWADNDEEATR